MKNMCWYSNITPDIHVGMWNKDGLRIGIFNANTKQN